jgi:hypothetical protein
MIGASSPIDYNQKFIDLVQHFDTFISERARKNPSIWNERVPRGNLPNFAGLTRQVNIFHGPVGEQAGLLNFRRIQQSRVPGAGDPGHDACAVQPKRFGYGWETRQYTGFAGEWESEPICVEDIAYTHMAKEQAQMIAMTIPKVTMSVWETWSREQYINTTVLGGNAYILARNGQSLGATNVAQFEYDPFDGRDFGNGELETFLRYPSAVQPGALEWSHLVWWQDYLGNECPDAALASDSGFPVFGLMINLRDFEAMIRNDPDLRQDYRDARPEALIDGFPTAFKKYRGWALMHDPRQARFKIHSVDADGSVVARRVKPMIEVAGTIGNTVEANKAYEDSELALGIIFMNEVYQNLVPTPVGTLGKDMVFGTQPGFNGEFTWMNKYDKQTNPLENTGNYFGRFRIFPKPLLYHNRAISFLYARCPHVMGSDCKKVAEDVTTVTSTTLSRDIVAGDYTAATRTLNVPTVGILALELGKAITIAITGGGTVSGFVIGTLTPTLVQVAFIADIAANLADLDAGNAVVLV